MFYLNNLRSVGAVWLEPREGDARDSESVFKAVEKDGVVDGVEGSGKIESVRSDAFPDSDARSEIVCDAAESCLSAAVGAIGRLQRMEEVVAYEIFVELT